MYYLTIRGGGKSSFLPIFVTPIKSFLRETLPAQMAYVSFCGVYRCGEEWLIARAVLYSDGAK